jgi:PAS domain S-box-containing protein
LYYYGETPRLSEQKIMARISVDKPPRRPSLLSRVHSAVFAASVCIAGLAASLLISSLQHSAEVNRERDRASLAVDSLRNNLSRELFSIVNLTQGLVDLVRVQGDIPQSQFTALARELTGHNGMIRNVALAPGNVIRFVYPLAGNEKAVGLDYMATPGQADAVRRAIAERHTVVAGPVHLVQGGEGIIGRTPIFLQDSNGRGDCRYWGIASAVIDFDSLMVRSGLGAKNASLAIALRGIDGAGSKGAPFWGDPALFTGNPVVMEVALPSGNWQMAALPKNGWPRFKPLTSWPFIAGLGLSILFSILIFSTIRISQSRAREIEQRRAIEIALRQKNRALQLFSECNSAVVHATDEQALLADICKIAVESAGYRLAWIGKAEHDEKKTVKPIAFAGPGEGFLDKIWVSWGDNENGRGTAGEAIRTGKPCIGRDLLGNKNFAVWREALAARDYASAIAVPLIVDETVFGVLLIYAAEPDSFDSTEVSLLEDLGSNISHGMTAIRSRHERRKALAALRERENQLSVILDNVSDAVFAVSVEAAGRFRFVSVNHGFLKATGLPPDRIVGALVSDVIPQPSLDLVLRKYREVAATGRPAHWEEETEYPTGRKVGHVTVAPVFDGSGICMQLVGTVHDITESKRAEEEIRKMNAGLEARVAERTAELAVAKERAEAADRLKSAFLATMSHELRTPLNSIIGFTGIILQGLVGELNDEQRKQLIMVRDSARHLLALINDVLDISKIEAGQLDLKNELYPVQLSIEKSVQVVRPLADKKSLSLAVDIEQIPLPVFGDKLRIEQVLINLLNNAIKFTDAGGVTISAGRPKGKADSGAGSVHISIKDTGIGIKPEDREKLFKPFRQIDMGTTRRYEGTGLGLSICKKLSAMLGGDILVASDGPGKGSTFTFVLPLGKGNNG